MSFRPDTPMATGVALTQNLESSKFDPSILARAISTVAIIASIVRSLIVGDYDFGSASALGVGIGLLGMAHYPVFAARASNLLSLVALIALSGKIIGCSSCKTNAMPYWLHIIATTLAIVLVVYLALPRPSRWEPVRLTLVSLALLGQIALICSFNMLCAPCLLTTVVIAGAMFPQAGNVYDAKLFRYAFAGCVFIAGISVVRGSLQPPVASSRAGQVVKREELLRNAADITGTVVVSAPDCAACAAAKPFIRGEKPNWTVIEPCEARSEEPCWNREKINLPTPTVLRLETDKATVVSSGFDHQAWRRLP